MLVLHNSCIPCLTRPSKNSKYFNRKFISQFLIEIKLGPPRSRIHNAANSRWSVAHTLSTWFASPSFLCIFLQDIYHEHFLSQTALNKKENELYHMVSVSLYHPIKHLSNFSKSCDRACVQHHANMPIYKTCWGCAYKRHLGDGPAGK